MKSARKRATPARKAHVAANEKLVERVRRCIGKPQGLSERKMFGCIAFFIDGNLACGVHEHELIVRVGPDTAEAFLEEPGTRPFDLSGRPMRGWLLVKAMDDDSLARWISRGVTYAASLPKK